MGIWTLWLLWLLGEDGVEGPIKGGGEEERLRVMTVVIAISLRDASN
jgi:hypothetical protein